MLIKDMPELKKHLGSIQKVGSFATWEPFLWSAEETYIVPAIGRELYAELEEITAPPNQRTADLLAFLKHATAWFAYMEAFPHLTVAVGDAGISVNTPTNSQAMGKWQFVALTKEAAAKADRYLEGALQYLERYAQDFPTWMESDAYTVNRARLVASATEATTCLPVIQKSRRLFMSLREYFWQAEDDFIRPIMGQQLEALLAILSTGEQIHPAERKALEIARRACVQLGFAQAVPYLNLNTDFRLVSETDGILNEDALTVSRLNAIAAKAEAEGEEKAADLRRYLNETATASILPIYFDSTLYEPPAAPGSFPRRSHDPSKPYFRL